MPQQDRFHSSATAPKCVATPGGNERKTFPSWVRTLTLREERVAPVETAVVSSPATNGGAACSNVWASQIPTYILRCLVCGQSLRSRACVAHPLRC
jgi:hypothetical protein